MTKSESVFAETSSVELIDADMEHPPRTEGFQGQEFYEPEPRSPSVQLLHTPKTVGELLRLEGYHKAIAKSFIFIQNTKETSDKLVDTMMGIIGELCEFKFFQTHSVGIDVILEEIEKDVETSGKPQVLIVEVTGTKGNISHLCEKIAANEQRQYGIWLRGYIRYLDPRVISLFDALFTFDMSADEYELLRTVIPLPSNVIKELRHHSDALRSRSKALFFLNHRRSSEGPLLERNPIVLSQIEEAPMDITPFIPIIVEATKFLFNEAGQWFAIARERTSLKEDVSESGSIQGQSATLNKQQFSSWEGDSESLKGMLDRVAVESSAYRIEGLVEQVQIHYKNLTDFEKTESEYGALVPQHVKRGIERESKAIVSKVQELQGLLSLVYQRELQI